jgi:RimJ/RimL family protein N-acetyltransferase
MTLHTGKVYQEGEITLRPPDLGAIQHANIAPDVMDSIEQWLFKDGEREDIYYFSIYFGEEVVGQIFLHDICLETDSCLIGYHLFQPGMRGGGIGTRALKLLQQYILEETGLRTIYSITSSDNKASWRIAQKCGFLYNGPPREDPCGVVHGWEVPRKPI